MWRISISIVAGCGAIAIALYLALRGHAPEAVPTAAAATVVGSDHDLMRALTMQAATQLEAQRARIDAECWTGARRPSRYDVQIALSPDGHEIARSIIELRDPPSRADVAACIRQMALPPVLVAPPSAPVTLTIPLVLP